MNNEIEKIDINNIYKDYTQLLESRLEISKIFRDNKEK